MNRREFLLLAGLAPVAARAREPIQLHSEPQQILSPAFFDASGRRMRIEDFRGRVVLLNLWATWCPPCRQEMPALDHLQRRLGGADFVVVPLSVDTAGPTAVRKFFGETGIKHLRPYFGEQLRIMLGFGIRGLPTTLLIDRNGHELARRLGPVAWDQPAVVDFLSGIIQS